MNCVTFDSIKVGTRFRFVYGAGAGIPLRIGDQVFTKAFPRRFVDGEGRRFTTGAKTAVMIEKSEAQS